MADPRLIDLTGRQIGRLHVLHQSSSKYTSKGNKINYWTVVCDCGKCFEVQGGHLRSGATKQCLDCKNKFSKKLNGKISQKFYYQIQKSAKIRNITFDALNITREYLDKLMSDQNKKCNLSGVNIKFADRSIEGSKGSNSASLDRIDSSLPYQVGNIQWVHKDINKMKGTLCTEEFARLCGEVSMNKNEFPVVSENVPIEGKVSSRKWSSINSGAKNRGIPIALSITKEYLWRLYIEQGRKCALSGRKIFLSVDGRKDTASLDRIDSTKPYSTENVQWVHKIVNRMKMDLDPKRFLELCNSVREHICNCV